MSEYIKREDMSAALSELLDSPYAVCNCEVRNALKLVKDIVNDKVPDGLRIPAADVRENVKSMWVFEYTKDMMFGEQRDIYHCIECKFKTSGKYNFCPNCGAEMR